MKSFVKMYAPNGAEVYLPIDPVDAQRALAHYERLGFSPVQPDEYQRERRAQVGFFAIRPHINGDGSETPVVDIYFRHQNGYVDRLRSMRVYLNTHGDKAAFEAAFGVALKSLSFYESDTPLDRGKLRPGQEKFLLQPRRPVWVVWRLNPTSESDEHAPKRLFVRWEREDCRQQPQPQTAEQPQPQTAEQPQPQTEQQTEQPQPQTAEQPQHDATPAAERATNNHNKRHHFASAEIVNAVSRAWGGLPPAKVVPVLYTAFKGNEYLTVDEAVAWAEANRPDAA